MPEKPTAERKYSVYICLFAATLIAWTDLMASQTVANSMPVWGPLIAFAVSRQIVKSATGK